MFKIIKLKKLKAYSHFIWLVALVSIVILVVNFYDQNKKNQIEYLKKSLNNIYLYKTFNKITSTLKPRYLEINYITKTGDTYESIINNLIISKI